MARGWRQPVRTGLVFGLSLVFITLIGLSFVLARLLAQSLGRSAPEGMSLGLMVYLGLMGLWCGVVAARRRSMLSWWGAVADGTVAALVAGGTYGVMVHVLAVVRAEGADIRSYLFQLSPGNIDLLQLGRPAPGGGITSAVVVTVAGVAGAVLVYAATRSGKLSAARTASARSIRRRVLDPLAQVLSERRGVRLSLLALGLGCALVAPMYLSEYWNSTLGTVGIYLLMGLGLNIVVGLAGLLDLGYVAFFAVGAYTVGLLTAPKPLGVELDFWLVLPLAVAVAAGAGVMLGLPVLRLRGDYLAIVTLGFGEIIRVLVMSQALAPVLGGPQGIRDIGGPALFGREMDSQRAFVYLMIVAIFVVVAFTLRLQDSRLGRSWVAMREDETVARATGINVYQAKLLAFAIGAAFAGLGGAIFASRNQYTGPEDHVLMVSINVLCLVIVGGMGSIPGIFAGAFVLKGLPEVLRPLQDYRLLAFGALLVFMMVVRPQGIWPSRRRRLELSAGRASPSETAAEPVKEAPS